jgi:hypothetical protein
MENLGMVIEQDGLTYGVISIGMMFIGVGI